jgi:hypothetical protein
MAERAMHQRDIGKLWPVLLAVVVLAAGFAYFIA